MNLETQQISGHIDEYLPFGWKYKEDVRHQRGKSVRTYHVLERDKDMRNYSEICNLEYQYFETKGEKEIYEEADPLSCVLLCLFLVFPLFVYLGRKSKQKKEIERRNRDLQEKMDELSERAEALL